MAENSTAQLPDCFDMDNSPLDLLILCIILTIGYVAYHFYVLHTYKDNYNGIIITKLLNIMCVF